VNAFSNSICLIVVIDLNSTNGTRLGLSQAPIKPSPKMYQLTDSKPVIFGKTVCVYEICEEKETEEVSIRACYLRIAQTRLRNDRTRQH
jgi:hypothetical protein